jgi:hypothetical protein
LTKIIKYLKQSSSPNLNISDSSSLKTSQLCWYTRVGAVAEFHKQSISFPHGSNTAGQQQQTYRNCGQQGQGTSRATQPGEINVGLLGKEQLPSSQWRTSLKPWNTSGEGKL